MGQFTQNGVIYEEMPNGKVKVVGYAQGSGATPLGGPDPMKPLDITGKSLANQRTQQEINAANATAASTAAKAKSDAEIARINALNAQDQYNAQHPPVSTSGVYGQDYLKTLSPSDRAMVQALDEGRLAFPQGSALRAPFWQEKLSQVSQFDPNFDATNFNARAKARANAISGKLGQSNNALNTAIGHLATLEGQIGGTASHNFTPFNAVENYVSKKFGDPGVTNFEDTASKLADELEAVYRNGGGAEQGVVRQLRNLDVNASQAQKEGIIENAMDLLASKMAANMSQYNFGTGGKPTWDMLDPHVQQVLSSPRFKSTRDKYFAAPSASNGSPPGAPPPPTGPTGGLGPSSSGFNEAPDPQSADFWESAARQQVPYRTALEQWKGDVRARGLVGVRPPPPGAYHKASAYIRDNPNVPYRPFESVTRTPVNPLDQAATDAAFSGPGVAVGHTANAFAGTLPTALAGEQGARYNAVSNAEHPNYAFAGDLAGTIGGAMTAGKAVKAGAPYLGRFGQLVTRTPGRTALTGDLLYGGTAGAGQNPDNPLLGAGEGMAAMAAGNAAGRYILGPAIRGAARASNRIARTFGAPEINIPAALDPGQNLVLNRANPILGDIRSNMQDAASLNLPYSLADASPQLRLLAGSAARKSPDVRATAENVFGPRQMGQGERAIAQINQNLAPVGDVPTLQANILKNARAQSASLYGAAKAHPVPELTANPQLKEILDRPAAQAAIRKGYDAALNRGEDVGTLTYATEPNGNMVQYGNPSWNVIHYARQALDASGETDVRRALDKQIASINPGFKAADAKYAGVMKGSDALQAGVDASGIKVTPEATQRAMAGFPNHGPQFQQGFASNMADQIERQRLAGNPYGLVYGSMGQRSKVASVFPQGAANFDRANALEGDMAKTGTELFGGSQTAPRTEADKMFDNPMADTATDLAFGLATGVPPPSLLKRGLGAFAKDSLRLGRGGKTKADKIGPLLLNTDPAANLAALDELTKLYSARQAYINRTRAMGGMFGSPLLGGPLIYGSSQ